MTARRGQESVAVSARSKTTADDEAQSRVAIAAIIKPSAEMASDEHAGQEVRSFRIKARRMISARIGRRIPGRAEGHAPGEEVDRATIRVRAFPSENASTDLNETLLLQARDRRKLSPEPRSTRVWSPRSGPRCGLAQPVGRDEHPGENRK